MLSRTAEHLFWMSRYAERAANTARLLQVRYEASLLAGELFQPGIWQEALDTYELTDTYYASYSTMTAKNVLHFWVGDVTQPASIAACLRAARDNARVVRATLSTQVWETHNQTWLAMQERMRADAWAQGMVPLLEWVQYRSHLVRGVMLDTMLQGPAFQVAQLGTFLERADHTARVLGACVQAQEPLANASLAVQGNGIQRALGSQSVRGLDDWRTVLQSTAAFEMYRKIYQDTVTPHQVVDALVFRAELPRSLQACIQHVVESLRLLDPQGARESSSHAGHLLEGLQHMQAAEILQTGSGAYITLFLAQLNNLSWLVAKDYLASAN